MHRTAQCALHIYACALTTHARQLQQVNHKGDNKHAIEFCQAETEKWGLPDNRILKTDRKTQKWEQLENVFPRNTIIFTRKANLKEQAILQQLPSCFEGICSGAGGGGGGGGGREPNLVGYSLDLSNISRTWTDDQPVLLQCFIRAGTLILGDAKEFLGWAPFGCWPVYSCFLVCAPRQLWR